MNCATASLVSSVFTVCLRCTEQKVFVMLTASLRRDRWPWKWEGACGTLSAVVTERDWLGARPCVLPWQSGWYLVPNSQKSRLPRESAVGDVVTHRERHPGQQEWHMDLDATCAGRVFDQKAKGTGTEEPEKESDRSGRTLLWRSCR